MAGVLADLQQHTAEHDAGRLLWCPVQALRARSVAEIGTARGASALWLAEAARRMGGRVDS